MLSDESSSDSETGRFKCQEKNRDVKSNNSNSKKNHFDLLSKSSGRNRRSPDRFGREVDRRRDERDKFERRSRERHRYTRSRYSPDRRRQSLDRSRDRNRKSTELHKQNKDLQKYVNRPDFRPREDRSCSKNRYRRSRSNSQKSPIPQIKNVKNEIKTIISSSDKIEKFERKQKVEKSSSPEVVKKSAVYKPTTSEVFKAKKNTPILIVENEGSDISDEVQPGSYYNMIPAIVKDKSEESSEIDSSDDEKLRAKLLNLEKELQKNKRKKHKKKHKRKSTKSDKEKLDSATSVEVTSTTDIKEIKIEVDLNSEKIETAEVTSTQKSNQKESSEEGEILSDDSHIDIDPNDLRHKLKRCKTNQDKRQNLEVCGPALPPHLEKRYRGSTSPVTEGPMLPPSFQNKDRNIGPSIPDVMRKVLADKTEKDCEIISYVSSDEDGIGPLPKSAENKWSIAHERLEERAIELKIKSLDGHSLHNTNIKSREQWMLELPEGKAKYLGLEARSFRGKEGPDMSDRSSWTDTPEDKARKALGIAKEEDANAVLLREARDRHITRRDEEQEIAVKKHKKKHKREESLLDMHQKKLKKKKKKEEKDDEKKERRPFSRDLDLQVNRFDEAQKKSIIKKAQDLNSRFSRGEAKFL